jgi:hypothetical protein
MELTNNLIVVRTQLEISEWKEINTDVRQGCSLSPLLLYIYEQNSSEMEIAQGWKYSN